MRIRRFIPVCLALTVLWTDVSAQLIPENALFGILARKNGTVQNIHLPEELSMLKTDSRNAESRTGSLLKRGADLYLTVDGTGRVYKALKSESGQLTFQRMDSTAFEGYNNMGFEFVHRDTLFSLGGYGFWRVNGHLRYFSDGREWYVAPLDRETPFHGPMAYYDSSKGSVYFIQAPYLDEATGRREDRHLAGVVDMRNRSSRILGRVRTDEGIQPGRFLFGSETLGGMVVDDFRSILLLDLRENKVWTLRNRELTDRMFGNSQNTSPIRFENRGMLYQYDHRTDRLDSFPVSKSDFQPTGQPVFAKDEGPVSDNRSLYTGLGLLALSTLAWVAYRYGVKKGSVPQPPRTEAPPHSNGNGKNGNQKETGFAGLDEQLIESVYRSSLDGRPFTAQEMNRVLGVARKSLEIQKKMRRESLVRINRRFRDMTGMDADLIVSRRSEEDKRYYHYLVTPEAWEAYRGIERQEGTD